MSQSVSFAIVTWNSSGEIRDCVYSAKEDVPDAEVIIVDNNSSDDTVEVLDWIKNRHDNVKLILNEENLGYTKACNQAMEAASGDYVFLLNPDARLTPGVTQKLINDFKNENVQAAAPQLLNDNGTIQPSCRNLPAIRDMYFEIFLLSKIFSNNPFFNRWKMGGFKHDESRFVEQPMAAALLIKKSTLVELSFMDERFKMFFNDVDLCKKIFDSGGKIYFDADVKMFHSKGVSIYKDRKRMLTVWQDDCLKYFKKYYGRNFSYNLFRLKLKFVTFFRKLFS